MQLLPFKKNKAKKAYCSQYLVKGKFHTSLLYKRLNLTLI